MNEHEQSTNPKKSAATEKPPEANTKSTVDNQMVAASAASVGKELALRRRTADAEIRRTTQAVSGELQHVLNEQGQTLRDPERLRALCAHLRATDRCPGECVIRSALSSGAEADLRVLGRRRR